jgi:hypothetical protein
MLSQNGIRKVVAANGDPGSVAKALGLSVLVIPVDDDPEEDIASFFAPAIHFLRGTSREPALVHCTAGVSRSATIVVAFMLFQALVDALKDAWPHDAAAAGLLDKRERVWKAVLDHPNDRFASVRHVSGCPVEACVALVRQTRPWVRPNYGFMLQLKAWSKTLADSVPTMESGRIDCWDGVRQLELLLCPGKARESKL